MLPNEPTEFAGAAIGTIVQKPTIPANPRNIAVDRQITANVALPTAAAIAVKNAMPTRPKTEIVLQALIGVSRVSARWSSSRPDASTPKNPQIKGTAAITPVCG